MSGAFFNKRGRSLFGGTPYQFKDVTNVVAKIGFENVKKINKDIAEIIKNMSNSIIRKFLSLCKESNIDGEINNSKIIKKDNGNKIIYIYNISLYNVNNETSKDDLKTFLKTAMKTAPSISDGNVLGNDNITFGSILEI